MATLPNGQIYPGQPALHPGFSQNVEGGILKAATTSTLASQAANVAAVKGLGAGQKGGRRTRKRRRFRGGGANVVPLEIPTANSIPGVDPVRNQIAGIDALNQLRTGAMYDKLANAAPYKVGGFRMRKEAEELGGRRKHRRKTKKHGRRSSRNHRRSHRKSSHRVRGTRRVV
jgi:hypothetical protein